jgi:hypothetical protein
MFMKISAAFGLLVTAHVAHAAQWALTDHDFSVSGNDVSLSLTGSSPNSCIPTASDVDRSGNSIVVTLAPLQPGVLCFSAFRGWEHTVAVNDLTAGSYVVDVREGDESIGQFELVMPATQGTAFDPAFAPTEGMWWSSDEPGTGMALSVDNAGRWFAALYIYNSAGYPTFFTLQGDAFDYDLSASAVEFYATGTSPLIRSQDGQCLECPWSQASVSDTGKDVRLEFWTRNRAVLSVGDWSIDLAPMPSSLEEADQAALPILDRHYAMTIDGAQGRHSVVVRGGPKIPDGFTGQTGATLECVDCRGVDDDGSASDDLDASLTALIETQMRFDCNETTCVYRVGDVTTTPFISQDGDVIVALATDAANPGAQPTRIELRLLPAGWRP